MAVTRSRTAGVLHRHFGASVARATRLIEGFDRQPAREVSIRGLRARGGITEQSQTSPDGADPQHMPHLVKDGLLQAAEPFKLLGVGRVELHSAVRGQQGPTPRPAPAGSRQCSPRTIDLADGRHDHQVVDRLHIPLEPRIVAASEGAVRSEVREFRRNQDRHPALGRPDESRPLGPGHGRCEHEFDLESLFRDADAERGRGAQASRIACRHRDGRNTRGHGPDRYRRRSDCNRYDLGIRRSRRVGERVAVRVAEVGGHVQRRRLTGGHGLIGDLAHRLRPPVLRSDRTRDLLVRIPAGGGPRDCGRRQSAKPIP